MNLSHKIYFKYDLIVKKRAKDILKNANDGRRFAQAEVVSPKLLFVIPKHWKWKQHIGFIKNLMVIY